MSTQEKYSIVGIHNLRTVSDSNTSQFQIFGDNKTKSFPTQPHYFKIKWFLKCFKPSKLLKSDYQTYIPFIYKNLQKR